MTKRTVLLWCVAVAVIATLIIVARQPRVGAPTATPTGGPAGATATPAASASAGGDAAGAPAGGGSTGAAGAAVPTATLWGAAPGTAPGTAPGAGAVEVAVTPIALGAPLDIAEAEISGLTWISDTLLLLPQYTGRFVAGGDVITDTHAGNGRVFGVLRADLERALAGPEPVVTPFAIPLAQAGFGESEDRAIRGFEGFEAIAVAGDRVYLSIEVQDGDAMSAQLAAGRVDVDAQGVPIGITLDAAPPVPVELPAAIDNMSLEALFADGDGVTALFEANGAAVNPSPKAFRFAADLTPLGEVPFPAIEYRVTDAGALGPDGTLWVINYMFPGDADDLRPGPDAVADRWGEGPSHAASDTVERLLRLTVGADGITLAEAPPIQLALAADGSSRNWEGLAELGGGFVLATDKFPSTILAYLPPPGAAPTAASAAATPSAGPPTPGP